MEGLNKARPNKGPQIREKLCSASCLNPTASTIFFLAITCSNVTHTLYMLINFYFHISCFQKLPPLLQSCSLMQSQARRAQALSGLPSPVFQLHSESQRHKGVSKNKGTPKSSILIGFSIIFTIQFGGLPLFLETPITRHKFHQISKICMDGVIYQLSCLPARPTSRRLPEDGPSRSKRGKRSPASRSTKTKHEASFQFSIWMLIQM